LWCPRYQRDKLLSRLRGSGGEEEEEEEEWVAKKASGGGIRKTCGVGVCVYRTKHGHHLKLHKAAI